MCGRGRADRDRVVAVESHGGARSLWGCGPGACAALVAPADAPETHALLFPHGFFPPAVGDVRSMR